MRKLQSSLSGFLIPGILLWKFCITLISLITCSISETARPTKISSPPFFLGGAMDRKKTYRIQSVDCENNSVDFLFSAINTDLYFVEKKWVLVFCSPQSLWEKVNLRGSNLISADAVTLHYLIPSVFVITIMPSSDTTINKSE